MIREGKRVAHGTRVSKRGHFLSLDDATADGAIFVRTGSATVPATRVHSFPEYNLALFAIHGRTFEGAVWPANDSANQPGTLLTALGPDNAPLGIGVVSVGPRSLLPRGFLGIQSEGVEDGVIIVRTLPKTPAANAGLKEGDIITALNGEPVEQSTFGFMVQGFPAGSEVTFAVRSGDSSRDVTVTLDERGTNESGRFRMMNRMTGPLSDKRSGFPSIVQHDIPLLPNQCGGPVVDLNGHCVGINVARAGRIKTYAIPANIVRDLLASVPKKAFKKRPSRPNTLSPEDTQAVRVLIDEIRTKLDDLERRLDAAPAP